MHYLGSVAEHKSHLTKFAHDLIREQDLIIFIGRVVVKTAELDPDVRDLKNFRELTLNQKHPNLPLTAFGSQTHLVQIKASVTCVIP